MKKNLFLLLSVYCFVVQPVVASFLRDDINFLYFAGINVIFIGIITGLYFSTQKWEKTVVNKAIVETKKEKVNKNVDGEVEQEIKKEVACVEEKTVERVVVKDPVVKTKVSQQKKKNSFFVKNSAGIIKSLIFFVSLVWIVVTSLYLNQMFSFELSLLLALLSGYLWFWILSSLFVPQKTNLFFKMYRYGLLLATLGMAVYVVYGDVQSPDSYIDDVYSQTKNYIVKFLEKKQEDKGEISKGEVIDVVLSSTGDVVDTLSGKVDLGSGNREVLSGNIVISGASVATGSSVTGNVATVERVKEELELSSDPLTMMQAIQYLFKEHNVVLDTRKNIKFKNLSYNHEDYSYFKTAYKKRLIGKNSNPDALLSCDTYIIMKGLVEWWKVKESDKKADIFSAYWNRAKQLDKLHWCKKGEKVSEKTL